MEHEMPESIRRQLEEAQAATDGQRERVHAELDKLVDQSVTLPDSDALGGTEVVFHLAAIELILRNTMGEMTLAEAQRVRADARAVIEAAEKTIAKTEPARDRQAD